MEKPADLIFGLDERPPLAGLDRSRLSERRGHVPLSRSGGACRRGSATSRRPRGWLHVDGDAGHRDLHAAAGDAPRARRLGLSVPAGRLGDLPLGMPRRRGEGRDALVAGMLLVSGLAECGLAKIVGKLRKIFPAVVSGIILMAVGLDLARIGMRIVWSSGPRRQPRVQRRGNHLGVTLVTMIALSVWGRGHFASSARSSGSSQATSSRHVSGR